MCDRKMPVKLKDKAMTYSSDCWAVKKKVENKLNSVEMRMLRWAGGKTRLDHISNEDIRKEADVKPVETFLENKRLVCDRMVNLPYGTPTWWTSGID